MLTLEEKRELFWKKVDANGGCLQYDLTNDIDREVYFAEIGYDEETVKQSYPAFYNAVMSSADIYFNQGGDVVQETNEEDTGFKDKYEIVYESVTRGSKKHNANFTSAMERGVTEVQGSTQSTTLVNLVKTQKIITTSIKLEDTTTPGAFSVVANPFTKNSNAITKSLDLLELNERFPKRFTTFVTRSTISSREKEGSPLIPFAMEKPETRENDMFPVISKVTVTAPSKINSKKDIPEVIVCYNRDKADGETPDYVYKDVVIENTGTDKKISIFMPAKGTAYIDDNFVIDSILVDKMTLALCQKNSGGKGAAIFDKTQFTSAELKKIFTISKDKKSVAWELPSPHNWKNKVSATNISNNAYFEYSFQFELAYSEDGDTTKADPPMTATVNVKSAQHLPPDTSSKYIEFIWIWWGCIGKDTTLIVDNGKGGECRKKVCDLVVGENVKTADNGFQTITAIYGGEEKEVIRLETVNDKSILLSAEHPVMTRRGFVRAEDLNVSDEIKTEDGYEAIKTLLKEPYNDMVYNIAFEEQCNLLCNGIEVGDFAAQQETKPQDGIESVEFFAPVEDDDVVKDMLAMNREQNVLLQERLKAKLLTDDTADFGGDEFDSYGNNFGYLGQHSSLPYYAGAFDDAKSSYVSIAPNDTFDKNSFSIEMWVYLNGGASRSILSQDNGFCLGVDGDSIVLEDCDGEEYSFKTSFRLQNSWNNIFITYDSDVLRMGINGMYVVSYKLSDTLFINENDIHIGKHLDGLVRRVMIYNIALDIADIRTRLFEAVYNENMKNLVAFIDMGDKQCLDLSPSDCEIAYHNNFATYEVVEALKLKTESVPTLNNAGHINPGGFSSCNFSICMKFYTCNESKEKAVLLSNGCFGDADSLIVYTVAKDGDTRDLILLSGTNEYILAYDIEEYAWTNLTIVYDKYEKAVMTAVNGTVLSKIKCDIAVRKTMGNVCIGNGFDPHLPQKDYHSNYFFDYVAIFDTTLTLDKIASFATDAPFVFDGGLVALYDLKSGLELVSRRELNLDTDAISVRIKTMQRNTEHPYNYNVDKAPKTYSKKAKIAKGFIDLYLAEIFGLDVREEKRDKLYSIYNYIEKNLLSDIGFAEIFNKPLTQKIIKKAIRRLNYAFLFEYLYMCRTNTQSNRNYSEFVDKNGINTVLSSARIVEYFSRESSLMYTDDNLKVVFDKLIDYMEKSATLK